MLQSFRFLSGVLLACTSLSTSAHALDPSALPTGGKVVSGQASITQSGNAMDIHQPGNRAILHWQSFDVGSGAQVQFHQPSNKAVTLNRVQAGNASQIHGTIRANGQIYLVNPSGVLFGPSARVDVGGLAATTHSISDQDFNAGNMHFQRNGANGKVINRGSITASPGGTVALIAPHVSNQGQITANGGTIALAAGETVRFEAGANGHLQVSVEGATIASLAENGGVLQADGGQVLLSAQAANAMLSSVVANTGTIQAKTIQHKNGRILLMGDMQGGHVRVNGTLDASAPSGGDGGFIETSAAEVHVSNTAKITTKAAYGESGTWRIDPDDYTIATSGGNMTGAALSAALQAGNVQIETNQAGAGGNGDILVNDAVSWSADNELHLLADRNIDISSNISATGNNAGLILEYGRTTGGSNYSLNNGARIVLSGATPSLQIGAFGAVQNFTVINDVNALQDMDLNLAGLYALGSNIDATATAGWNAGAGFSQVGYYVDAMNNAPFTGQFHGLGNTVNGLFINRPTEDRVGLFGYADGATFRDITVSNANISADWETGALVGSGFNSTLRNTHMTGTVNGANGYTGGLAGYLESSTIDTASADSTVHSGANYGGGLIGYLNQSSIRNASADTALTSGGGTGKGGLLGRSRSNTLLDDLHATGTVQGSTRSGGLIGWSFSDAAITDSSAEVDITGNDDEIGGLVGYVQNSLQINNSYAIGTLNGANYVGGLVGRAVTLLTITDSYATVDIAATNEYAGGLVGYMPGGSLTNVNVTATTISGGGSYVGGLVGHLATGTVTNAHAVADAISGGNQNTGGLIGLVGTNSTIDNSSATATVTGWSNYTGGLIGSMSGGVVTDSYAITEVSGGLGTGGLIGRVSDAWPNISIIRNSYVRGTFVDSGGNPSVGGLIGWSQNNPVIEDSYALIDVIGSDAVGGLIGLHEGWGVLEVYRSWAGGNVTGTGSDVGGLIGAAGTTGDVVIIEDSYASGNVTGVDNVGGLIGYGDLLDVTNTYASGAVNGTTDVGGLVGELAAGTIVSSYWNSQTSGAVAGVANGSNVGVTALTTAQIQNTASFTGWDIGNTGGGASVWRIYEGQTSPLLRQFLTPLTVTAEDTTIYTIQAPFTNGSVTYSTAPDMGLLLGTVAYGGTAQGATQAGTYVITPSGLYSTQTGYDISYADGQLTILQFVPAQPPQPQPPTPEPTPTEPPKPGPIPPQPEPPSVSTESPDGGELERFIRKPHVEMAFSDQGKQGHNVVQLEFLTLEKGYIPLEAANRGLEN